jgi:hypothetical protein
MPQAYGTAFWLARLISGEQHGDESMMLKFAAALAALVLASTVAAAQYNGSTVTPMPKNQNQTPGQSNTLNSGIGHPGVGPTGAPTGTTGAGGNQNPNPAPPPPPPSSGSFAPPRR